MHFDDRLGTVLRLRASGAGLRRIQLRQVLDLLGTSPAEARGEQLDAAYAKLAELSAAIPAPERTAMLREPALRLRSPRLAAALAAQEPAIAATALQRAQLSPEQWLDLIPALSPAARPALRQRRDLPPEVAGLLVRLGINDRGLPPAPAAAAAELEPDGLLADSAPLREQGIGAIVRRIEAYRRSKQVGGGVDVTLGWSSNPAPPQWAGGAVAGIIGPKAKTEIRVIADPPLAGLAANARPDPANIANNHLSYAVQWFLFALTALVIYALALRKRLAAQ